MNDDKASPAVGVGYCRPVEKRKAAPTCMRASVYNPQAVADARSASRSMDISQIIDRLAERPDLPVEALRAATADRASAAPIFLDAIEQFLAPDGRPIPPGALFFVFHLLGEWREKSAYRPLARLLRRPRDEVDAVFGDSITATTHRVMAAVFDGDAEPLRRIILAPDADEFVRSRMCEALAMVSFDDATQRAETARFLRACYTELVPQDECFVWNGWQSAIALLGLVELKPLVEQAFTRGFISPAWLSFAHFERDLALSIENPATLRDGTDGEYSLFGDTIEELSDWYCFSAKAKEDARHDLVRLDRPRPPQPVINSFRKVGRNDPCPCGSGRKFKKCCLLNEVGATSPEAN